MSTEKLSIQTVEKILLEFSCQVNDDFFGYSGERNGIEILGSLELSCFSYLEEKLNSTIEYVASTSFTTSEKDDYWVDSYDEIQYYANFYNVFYLKNHDLYIGIKCSLKDSMYDKNVMVDDEKIIEMKPKQIIVYEKFESWK